MSKKVVKEFIACINEHDVEGLMKLMAEDHVFIDAHGTEARGRYLLRNAWTEYFEWFPDYKLVAEEIYEKKGSFAVFGFASGTYRGMKSKENFWMLPAAWRVVVENNLVKEWQVYSDTKVVSEIIAKNR